MTKEEYFGGWLKVLPEKEMQEVISKVKKYQGKICPAYKNIFKAFQMCPYEDLKVVILGQDPYPQRDIATGIAFANDHNTPEDKLSPSLQVIKESVINYEIPHNFINFAPDLEDWERQGVLLLNTALTCEVDKVGSHSLLWRPFISHLIANICYNNTGIVFLLLGNYAQSFTAYINQHQHIIAARHPSYYYRNHEKMPYSIWHKINELLIGMYGSGIIFYKESRYESDLY